jgi:zinc protease
MVGYTVPTWYGAGGWGTLNRFQDQPGRFSVAESFFINDVAITRRLAKEFPGHERFAPDHYEDENPGALARPLGVTLSMPQKEIKDLLGLTWDHDTLALYGDPAWDARIAPNSASFDQALRVSPSGWELEVTANQDGLVSAFAFLPHQIDATKYQLSGPSQDALLTNAYVLVDFGPMKKGEKKTAAIKLAE